MYIQYGTVSSIQSIVDTQLNKHSTMLIAKARFFDYFAQSCSALWRRTQEVLTLNLKLNRLQLFAFIVASNNTNLTLPSELLSVQIVAFLFSLHCRILRSETKLTKSATHAHDKMCGCMTAYKKTSTCWCIAP